MATAEALHMKTDASALSEATPPPSAVSAECGTAAMGGCADANPPSIAEGKGGSEAHVPGNNTHADSDSVHSRPEFGPGQPQNDSIACVSPASSGVVADQPNETSHAQPSVDRVSMDRGAGEAAVADDDGMAHSVFNGNAVVVAGVHDAQRQATVPAMSGQLHGLAELPPPSDIADSKAIAAAQATLRQQLLATASRLEGELAQVNKAAQVKSFAFYLLPVVPPLLIAPFPDMQSPSQGALCFYPWSSLDGQKVCMIAHHACAGGSRAAAACGR